MPKFHKTLRCLLIASTIIIIQRFGGGLHLVGIISIRRFWILNGAGEEEKCQGVVNPAPPLNYSRHPRMDRVNSYLGSDYYLIFCIDQLLTGCGVKAIIICSMFMLAGGQPPEVLGMPSTMWRVQKVLSQVTCVCISLKIITISI